MSLNHLGIRFNLLLAFCSVVFCAILPREDPVDPVYRFSTNHKVENLAVRSNGKVLGTVAVPVPQLWEFDPFNATAPVLVEEFPGVTGCLGITELGEDVFYVATGNFTLYPSYTGVPGTFYIYEVDMNKFRATKDGVVTHPASIRKASHVTEASILNGVTSMPGSRIATAETSIFVADTGANVIWSINVYTGRVTLAAQDETMMPPSDAPLPIGVNGALYRLPLNPDTGLVPANSTAEMLLQNLDCDDFCFDEAGQVYVAGPSNDIEFANLHAGSISVIARTAGSNTSTLIAPKAVQLGRANGSGYLFVVTNRGANNPVIGSQGLSRIFVGDRP